MQFKHLDSLDGWRGLAIALLLIGHYFPIPGVNLGAVGVQLFFVLSGLLMARILFLQQVPIGLFYRRRIARIFPAAYFFLFAVAAALCLARRDVNWHELASAALFVNNYFPGQLGHATLPYGHFWSLCVEEHSYILLSLIAVLARRGMAGAKPLVGAAAAACALFGVYYWTRHQGRELFGDWLHTEVSAFSLFASAFLTLHFHGRRLPALPLPAYAALLAAGILIHWWRVPLPVQTVAGGCLLALLVNLLPTAPDALQALLAGKPLRLLGLWSYSIYLWQQVYYLYGDDGALAQLGGLLLSVAAGICSYYLLEKPARGYLNRKWGQRAATLAPLPAE